MGEREACGRVAGGVAACPVLLWGEWTACVDGVATGDAGADWVRRERCGVVEEDDEESSDSAGTGLVGDGAAERFAEGSRI